MRVVFMGTPEYAVAPLDALLAAPFAEVVAVFTQPDRPAGRGGAPTATPVGRHCADIGLPVHKPASFRTSETIDALARLAPDVVAVAAYGKLLPAEALTIPRRGCLNIHPSLLPRHRGPSPVVTAILEGDTTTGVTVMLMNEEMDSGPVLAQQETEVGPDETAGSLTMRLMLAGGELLRSVLPQWAEGDLAAVEQDGKLATFTRKIAKADGAADWAQSAVYLARQVRAFDPWPGLYTRWKGGVLKVTKAWPSPQPLDSAISVGTVVHTPDGGVAIATGDGLLELGELQMEGKRAVPATEFIRGRRDFVGSALPS